MADLKTPKGHTMAKIAGNPDTLAGEVTRMKNVAATIEKLTGMLSDIHNKKNSQSQKIDKIRDTAGDAGEALDKAKSLYNGTGWALGEYQKQLNTSVKNGNTAYDNAVALLPSLNAAETAHNTAVSKQKQLQNDPTPSTPEEAASAKTKLDNAGTDVSTTHATLSKKQELMDGYKTTWDTAYEDLNTAADTARGHIKKVIDDSPAKDSWWDNLAGFLQALSSILGWVALVLVIAAIFLTGPLALAFLAVATALTAVKLLTDAALAAGGKGKWIDVAFDAIGLIPFGKLLGPGSKLASRIPNAGRELAATFSKLKPSEFTKGPAALKEAVDLSSKTLKGTTYQSAKWAQEGQKALDGATSRWNVWQSLKAGGSAEFSKMSSVLDNLPGRNQLARDAIDVARNTLPESGTAVGAAYAVQQSSVAGFSGYVAGVRGDDWVTNQITHTVHEAFFAPSDSDLKARIQAAPMLVPAEQLAEPDWGKLGG